MRVRLRISRMNRGGAEQLGQNDERQTRGGGWYWPLPGLASEIGAAATGEPPLMRPLLALSWLPLLAHVSDCPTTAGDSRSAATGGRGGTVRFQWALVRGDAGGRGCTTCDPAASRGRAASP